MIEIAFEKYEHHNYKGVDRAIGLASEQALTQAGFYIWVAGI